MNLFNDASAYLKGQTRRLTAISESETIQPSEIERGIVFVWALWSVPAKIAIDALGKALAELPELKDLQIYVINTDSPAAEQFMSSISHVPEGKGETFWIRNGVIVAELNNYAHDDIEVLKRHTNSLLS